MNGMPSPASSRACWSMPSRNVVQMRVIHRPGVKSSDLIVVEIGCNECLCGEGIGHLAHEIQLDAEPFEALKIQQGVVSYRSHDQRVRAQELQVISDVACATSELAPQLGNEERHVQYVDLFWKDVLPETAAKYHDVVVRDRAADQSTHGISYE